MSQTKGSKNFSNLYNVDEKARIFESKQYKKPLQLGEIQNYTEVDRSSRLTDRSGDGTHMPDITGNSKVEEENFNYFKRYHIPSVQSHYTSKLGRTKMGADYIQNLKDIQKRKLEEQNQFNQQRKQNKKACAGEENSRASIS